MGDGGTGRLGDWETKNRSLPFTHYLLPLTFYLLPLTSYLYPLFPIPNH